MGSTELWQRQGLASSWGGPEAPQVGRPRHWLKLDEAEASALPPHIQITGTLGRGGHTASLEELTPRRCPWAEKPHPVLPIPGSRKPGHCRHHTPVLHGAGLVRSALTASTSEFFLLLHFLPQLHVQLIAHLRGCVRGSTGGVGELVLGLPTLACC